MKAGNAKARTWISPSWRRSNISHSTSSSKSSNQLRAVGPVIVDLVFRRVASSFFYPGVCGKGRYNQRRGLGFRCGSGVVLIKDMGFCFNCGCGVATRGSRMQLLYWLCRFHLINNSAITEATEPYPNSSHTPIGYCSCFIPCPTIPRYPHITLTIITLISMIYHTTR